RRRRYWPSCRNAWRKSKSSRGRSAFRKPFEAGASTSFFEHCAFSRDGGTGIGDQARLINGIAGNKTRFSDSPGATWRCPHYPRPDPRLGGGRNRPERGRDERRTTAEKSLWLATGSRGLARRGSRSAGLLRPFLPQFLDLDGAARALSRGSF